MNKVFGNTIIDGILVIILGIFLLVNPEGSMNLVLKIIGVILLIMAAGRLVPYWRSPEERTGSALTVGILQVVIGLFLIIAPNYLTNFAFIVFAIFIGYGAILSLSRAMKSRKMGFPVSKFSVLMAVLTLALAVVVLIKPNFLLNIAVQLVGIALIVEGVTLFTAPGSTSVAARK